MNETWLVIALAALNLVLVVWLLLRKPALPTDSPEQQARMAEQAAWQQQQFEGLQTQTVWVEL